MSPVGILFYIIFQRSRYGKFEAKAKILKADNNIKLNEIYATNAKSIKKKL